MSDSDDHGRVDAEGDEHQDPDREDYSEVDDHTDEIHGHEVEEMDRVTSPMQSYSMRQVGIGLAVLAVGLLVAFVLPYVAVAA